MAADKSKGAGVQWPFGWGKKKGEKELEALPTPEAEVLKVPPMPYWLLFGEVAFLDCHALTSLQQVATMLSMSMANL